MYMYYILGCLIYRLEKVKTFFGFQHGKWGEGDHMWIPNHHTTAEDKDSKVYFRAIRGWQNKEV